MGKFMQGDSGFRLSGFRSPSIIDTDNQRSVSKVGIGGRLMPHVECKMMHSLVATFGAITLLRPGARTVVCLASLEEKCSLN